MTMYKGSPKNFKKLGLIKIFRKVIGNKTSTNEKKDKWNIPLDKDLYTKLLAALLIKRKTGNNPNFHQQLNR